jgi:hypothetical protein
MTVKLTKSNINALSKIYKADACWGDVFSASSIGLHGSQMLSLEGNGLVERADPDEGDAFVISTQGSNWRVTEKGANLVDKMPKHLLMNGWNKND